MLVHVRVCVLEHEDLHVKQVHSSAYIHQNVQNDITAAKVSWAHIIGFFKVTHK